MASLAIDTLKLTSTLKSRGFTEQQALGLSEAIQQIDLDQVVTRSDLRADLAEMKFELLKWMFGGFLGMFIMLATVLLRLNGMQ